MRPTPPSLASDPPDTPGPADHPASAVTTDPPVAPGGPLASSRPERLWLSRLIRERGRLWKHAAPSYSSSVRLHSGAFDSPHEVDAVQDDRVVQADDERVAATSHVNEVPGSVDII